jgi:flagellar hook-associated protein 1 FlgK
VTDSAGNTVTHDTVTIAVSKDYLKDLNKSNLSDQGGIINLGNQEFYYDSWEYDVDAEEYTFILSDSTKNSQHITNDRVGKNASIGSSVDYQGIPYYMSQMNEWVRTFAEKFNDILTSGVTEDNEPGTIMFTGDMATTDEQYSFSVRYDNGTAGVKVSDTSDSYYRLTAKNFSILSAMEDNPDILATKKSASDGVEQSDLLKELKNMATDKTKMSFRGASASEFLQCILSDVALNASRANTFQECYTNIASSIDNQRLSISGVDEDEEAVNLVKYQNAYNLASKMIQTLTEVYDRLILETGV